MEKQEETGYNLEPIKQDINNFIGLYSKQQIKISSQDEYIKAGDLIKIVKNKINKIEEQRKSWTKPLDESKKRIMENVRDVIDPLKDFESSVKQVMTDWYMKEKARKDKEQAKLEERAKAKAIKEQKECGADIPIMPAIPVVNDIKTQRGDMSVTTMKKVWKFKVIDETKVPREYLSLDEVEIRRAIREGKREIKGLEIYQEDQLNIR